MRSVLSALIASLVVSGCAATMARMYGTKRETDKFNDNLTWVTMTGGVIDANRLGIVANAAEFNPLVIRSRDNKILATGILFTFENNVTLARARSLSIREGSTATFLLNNGAEKIELRAVKGDSDYSVTAAHNAIYTTYFDRGVFSITPDQLKQIVNASAVEVRVSGATSYIDFPRKPNNHVVEDFLPSWKKFYEREVQPYLGQGLPADSGRRWHRTPVAPEAGRWAS